MMVCGKHVNNNQQRKKSRAKCKWTLWAIDLLLNVFVHK